MADKAGQLQAPRTRQRWLHQLLVVLVLLGVLTLVLETSSLVDDSGKQVAGKSRLRQAIDIGLSWHHRIGNASVIMQGGVEMPVDLPGAKELEVSDEDLLHLSLLHEACVADENVNASLPWQFGSPGHQLSNGSASNPQELMSQNDTDLLQKLRQCPGVDIFLPEHLHGNGYCEDAVAYAKYLESRLLPSWALEVKLFDPDLGRSVDYYDLCPETPMIFFNHYWDGVPKSPRWPKGKPIYLMPNIEMLELTAEHYWGVDVVLCKTQVCYDRVTQWYVQEGNPRNTQVFYTKHTSSDQAYFARRRLGEDAIAPKNFSTIKFLHTAGGSAWKGTKQLLDCWTSTPGLPHLDVYMDRSPFYRLVPGSYVPKLQHSNSSVKIHLGMLDSLPFNKMTAEAAFIMCPSWSEGYGHYINQARASGAVVFTTDVPPMNELINSSEIGVLISSKRKMHPMVLLGGNYKGEHGLKNVEGLVASFSGASVCKAVQDFVNSTTSEQRATIGVNARRKYHEDTLFFAQAMQELRKFARTGRSIGVNDTRTVHE
ncbi:hypothetical protein PHYBOEH_006476 [Phytophthora boehmeriae]|uniref:Glycosyl transferase family 1 domain-containing protein n=1 Tax=Phytophthora boehmeriae TaxID=109152 RepID=A0A8T1WEJ1_9STRA|nr:hypothetical protein PHYBOEH_006476 [Phytophthora boehmeriae]